MRKSFQYKLYQNDKNRHLHAQIDIAGHIYNHCIAVHRRYYRLYKQYLPANRLKVHLTRLKKQPRFCHWKSVGSQAIQDIVERIDRGYCKFFRKENRRPPSFRRVRNYRSITLKQAGYRLLSGNQIRLGKGRYRYFHSRDLEGVPKTLTIKRDALGELYLFFSCELEDRSIDRVMTSKSAGFDFGLKTFLTPSFGEEIEFPEYFKSACRRIAQANRQLSSKQKGSKRRQKAREHLARVHRQVARQRKDYQFKLAKRLSEEYDHLFFEDLNLEGMKRRWGRKVSDLGFSEFLKILKYQCSKTGAQVHTIDRFFPSSKRCSDCLKINAALTLRERVWTCSCGVLHQRDRNAAINIHLEGASSCGLGKVRPVSTQAIAA